MRMIAHAGGGCPEPRVGPQPPPPVSEAEGRHADDQRQEADRHELRHEAEDEPPRDREDVKVSDRSPIAFAPGEEMVYPARVGKD